MKNRKLWMMHFSSISTAIRTQKSMAVQLGRPLYWASGEMVNKSQEEQKQLEEKRKQKNLRIRRFGRRKRLEVQEVFDNAKRKQKEILQSKAELKRKR